MKHLKEVNQSYFEHLIYCLKGSALYFKTSFTLLIHGFIPKIWPGKPSRLTKQIIDLYHKNHK